uniref:Uncharacterized protein n=1 Tax=Amphimedon queenslandica TaxID=400682 RepID=A0A1X7V0R9_AMPQE
MLQEKEKELEKLKSSHPSANSRKQLHEVGKRKQRRKLAAIKESAKEALKFAETYKLDLKSVSFARSQNDTLTFEYSSVSPSTSSLSSVPLSISSTPSIPISSLLESSSQESNTSPDALLISDFLFLLNSYGVSDEFYYELSMLDKSLS